MKNVCIECKEMKENIKKAGYLDDRFFCNKIGKKIYGWTYQKYAPCKRGDAL